MIRERKRSGFSMLDLIILFKWIDMRMRDGISMAVLTFLTAEFLLLLEQGIHFSIYF